MAYKSMVRQAKIKKMNHTGSMEYHMDEWLKEGTDQGWTLHKMHVTEWNSVQSHIVHMVWETND